MEISGASARRLQQACARVENASRGGAHGANTAVDRRPIDLRCGVPDDGAEPGQLVNQAHDHSGGGAQAGRTVRRRKEDPAEVGNRGARSLHHLVMVRRGRSLLAAGHALNVRTQPRRDGAACPDCGVSQWVARRRRPQQRHGQQGGAGCQAPPGQSVGDRGVRAGEGHRQDECQQQRGCGARQDRADHACEQHGEGDDRH